VTWPIGRETILQMLDAGELELVPPDRPFADNLINKASKHLITARVIAVDDPEIAFDALYTAARLALTAILATQGLRPTTKGGHIAPIAAVRAQTGVPCRSASTVRPTETDPESDRLPNS
jgi:hypothetical protein